jgi:hypothetical protein
MMTQTHVISTDKQGESDNNKEELQFNEMKFKENNFFTPKRSPYNTRNSP